MSDYAFFLPTIKDSYHVVYQRCCRNETITNIISPNETGNTYTVEITPEAQLTCNSSPQFNTFPPAVICTNQPFSFEHNANDKDGDSLVYAFTAPLLGGGLDLSTEGRSTCSGVTPSPPCPPPYNEVSFIGDDFDSAHPFGNTLQIDPSTGIISGTPTIQGHYLASIGVSEYRNGILLSSTQREFQITIADCEQLNERTGSVCDDSNPNTENDRVQADCSCKGTVKEAVSNTPDLFFSEYIEGEGDNKCLEIFNPLEITVDLSEYEVKVFSDGSQNGQILKKLTGSLAPKGIYTICKNASDPLFLGFADATFEGDYDGNANNTLINSIPENIGLLQNLTALNFSNNQFSGCYPTSLLNHCDINPDFSNNSQLPWKGDFLPLCLLEEQTFANCDDNNPNTVEDRIQENCTCAETIPDVESECANFINLGNLIKDTTIVICDDAGILHAITPIGFSGKWTSTSEDIIILQEDTSITRVESLPIGNTLFTWTLDTLNCETYEPSKIQIMHLNNPILNADTFFLEEQPKENSFEVITNDQLMLADYTIELLNATTLNTIINIGDGTFQYRPPTNLIRDISFDYQICYDACPDYCDQTTVKLIGPILSTNNSIVPNAITPNGDALNEFLFFWHLTTPEKYPNNELIIFNRWGDIVYKAMPYDNTWNGTNNQEDTLPEGTYYYILRLDLNEGEILRGTVTILR